VTCPNCNTAMIQSIRGGWTCLNSKCKMVKWEVTNAFSVTLGWMSFEWFDWDEDYEFYRKYHTDCPPNCLMIFQEIAL